MWIVDGTQQDLKRKACMHDQIKDSYQTQISSHIVGTTLNPE